MSRLRLQYTFNGIYLSQKYYKANPGNIESRKYAAEYLYCFPYISQLILIFFFKVVDFGCGELKLFKYLKRIENINHVSAVDIDEKLILNNTYDVKPLLFDHIGGFCKKLSVDLFCGSIAEPDERLVGVDAVICIELYLIIIYS